HHLQSCRSAGRLRNAEEACDLARAYRAWARSAGAQAISGGEAGVGRLGGQVGCGAEITSPARRGTGHSIAWTSSSAFGFPATRDEPIVSTNGKAATHTQVSSRNVLS